METDDGLIIEQPGFWGRLLWRLMWKFPDPEDEFDIERRRFAILLVPIWRRYTGWKR